MIFSLQSIFVLLLLLLLSLKHLFCSWAGKTNVQGQISAPGGTIHRHVFRSWDMNWSRIVAPLSSFSVCLFVCFFLCWHKCMIVSNYSLTDGTIEGSWSWCMYTDWKVGSNITWMTVEIQCCSRVSLSWLIFHIFDSKGCWGGGTGRARVYFRKRPDIDLVQWKKTFEFISSNSC